jgi:hypothetical protein
MAGGILTVLFGLFTMAYSGDVEGGEPAVGAGAATALCGVVAIAAGLWALRRSGR